MASWSRSGMLANIQQMGLELHIGEDTSYVLLMEGVKSLYEGGWRLVMFQPRLVVGKGAGRNRFRIITMVMIRAEKQG